MLGIEPAANVAKVAVEKGVPTLVRFFGAKLAKELAARRPLRRSGSRQQCAGAGSGPERLCRRTEDSAEARRVLTLEFPHLLRLIEHNEFDTIYHEHFSYFSMLTTVRILEAHGLKVFDVEELTTHGGSLRVYACRAEASDARTSNRVSRK